VRVENNLVSVVTLGSFNPSILTSDFLIRECGLEIEGKVTSEERTPVVSRVDYPGLSFFAGLDRFQIKETGVDDPGKSRVVEFLRIYLEKLLYTPLSRCGVNINVNISEIKERNLITLLTERKKELFKILGTEDFSIETRSRHRPEEDEYLGWTVIYVIEKEDILGRLTMSRKGNSVYELNYNYEVAKLEKNHRHLERITKGYPRIVKHYERVIRAIFEEG
jgi:hypothetical protein